MNPESRIEAMLQENLRKRHKFYNQKIEYEVPKFFDFVQDPDFEM